MARRRTQTIINAVRDAGAAVIITACPLCQANLEMRQTVANGERLPAIYFTEAMGLAFGLRGADLWWKKHLIDPRPLLRSLELV
jgi:heterodisulfide reductase subunit B